MKVVIDIPADLKKMLFDDEVFDIAHSYRLAMCVKNGTQLPKGATNGDMIKAMFPNELLTSITSTLWWGDNMSFNKDWWDAPYNPTQNMQNADKSGLEYADQPTLRSAT
jgi:hypothetical protein